MDLLHKYSAAITPELERYRGWRHELHQIPELCFQEHKTSAYVAQRLQDMGVEFTTGWAGTGLVAWVRRGNSERAIGLRTELDGLPIAEANDLSYKSQHADKMHACGHDGHMAMLLAACDQIKNHARFDGTVYFIFQPAEEGGGGADVMIREGMFERYPMQSVYGMHNFPNVPAGDIAATSGAVMAAVDEFHITFTGRGGHAARPHVNIDPIVAGAHAVCALQSIVSRNTNPNAPLVVSVTQFHSGTATNVIPETARLVGTVRSFAEDVRDATEARIRAIIEGACQTFDLSAEIDYQRSFPVTINDADSSARCAQLATELLGADRAISDMEPSLGGEDFAYMLQHKPGCYAKIGNGTSADLHSCHYDFNDEIILPGVAYWRHLAESLLPAN